MAKITKISRYDALVQQNAKRRSIVQQGMSRSDAMRSYLAANINKTASMQVQTSEMQLRANAQAAAKAKTNLNKLA